MKKIKVIGLYILTAAAMFGCKQQAQQTSSNGGHKLLTLQPQKISLVQSYSASIRGKQDIEIYPQIGGYLAELHVNEGQTVKAGETLFVIEQAPYIAAYEAAKASVAMAETSVATAELNYNNTLALKEQNIVSDADLQIKRNALMTAKSQLDMSKAQLVGAKTNLDFTVIKSPSDGVIGKLPYRKGALVSASLRESLTVVSDNSEMYVYFSLNENQVLNLIDKFGSLDSIASGMGEVKLQLSNGSIYPYKGRIESVSGIIEERTGAVSVRGVFPNNERRLLSGGAGNVIITETYDSAIVVPKVATFELQDKVLVYKIVDNKAKSTIIDIAKGSTDKEFIVLGGVSIGDEIIAEGAGLVREGTIVK